MSRSVEVARPSLVRHLLAVAATGLVCLASAGRIEAAGAGKLGIGTPATAEQIAGWDIDVRPDGQGLPPNGKGTVAQGEAIFQERCAVCHGEFGEGIDRWPVLAGGHGSLKAERPEKTIGSFWPSVSTVFDYVKRAMPYGNAQSLTDDELYAVVAYILNLNDIVKDPNFELSAKTYASIRLPNADGFYDDDRETVEKAFWKKNVCMSNCGPERKVMEHARILDVTPDAKSEEKVD
ncbi:MAG: cytochrome c [Hyphomicrobiaceae bacterium]|nr:cytochrome c [Hyphomicrobiaceae bacterium]